MAHRKHEGENSYINELWIRRQFPEVKEHDNQAPRRKKLHDKNRSVFESDEDELRYYYGPRYP